MSAVIQFPASSSGEAVKLNPIAMLYFYDFIWTQHLGDRN